MSEGRGSAALLEELEAALWRWRVPVAGVDEALALARELVARAAEEGSQLGQVRWPASGGERLREGVGTGVEAEPGPELAVELAAKVVSGEGVGGAGARGGKRNEGSLSRDDVSPANRIAEVGAGAKACRACRRELPGEAFYRKGAGWGEARRATCKRCEGARRAVRRRELAAVRELARRGVDAQALLALLEARRQADRERALVALRLAALGPAERALVVDLLDATAERLALAELVAEGEAVARPARDRLLSDENHP